MAEEEKSGDEEASAGGKKKLFIIIGAVVLLLIIGGVAAFLLMGDDEEAASEETTEEVAEVEEEKTASYRAVPGKKEPGFVIILQEGSRFKQAQVALQLFTYSPALNDYLAKNVPMIRHHIVNYLGTEPAENFIDRAGREKIQQGLKQKLIEAIEASPNEEEKRLGQKLEDVYFTKFVLQ